MCHSIISRLSCFEMIYNVLRVLKTNFGVNRIHFLFEYVKQLADFYKDAIGSNFDVFEPPLNVNIFSSNFAQNICS